MGPSGGRRHFLLLLQYRHYKACLEIFKLKPTGDSKEFAELVSFIAQVMHPTPMACCVIVAVSAACK